MPESAGIRFLAAFNDIEDHLRRVLNADAHREFIQLARDYANRKHLPREQRDALAAFAALRNAISHGRYYGGRPIAEPVQEVVEQIERLRDQISSPPLAMTVLGSMDVCSVSPADPIGAALAYVRRFDYSQLPVYDEGVYTGLLTTNAVARWLAAQLAANDGLAETEPVHEVLKFAEAHEKALLVPRTITASEATDRLSGGADMGPPAIALIVTANGLPHEKPLAVIAGDDRPALAAALSLT